LRPAGSYVKCLHGLPHVRKFNYHLGHHVPELAGAFCTSRQRLTYRQRSEHGKAVLDGLDASNKRGGRLGSRYD
jgi:hypothetical protein